MAATKYKSRGSDTSSSSGSTAARDPKVTKVTVDFVDDYRPVPAARSHVLHRFLARSSNTGIQLQIQNTLYWRIQELERRVEPL